MDYIREETRHLLKDLVGMNSGFVSKGDKKTSKESFEQRNEKICCVFLRDP